VLPLNPNSDLWSDSTACSHLLRFSFVLPLTPSSDLWSDSTACSLFSQTSRRAAYLCIKREKRGERIPYKTTLLTQLGDKRRLQTLHLKNHMCPEHDQIVTSGAFRLKPNTTVSSLWRSARLSSGREKLHQYHNCSCGSTVSQCQVDSTVTSFSFGLSNLFTCFSH